MAKRRKQQSSASQRISSGLGAVSDRLKQAAKLDRDQARSVLGTRLIAIGLALVFVAGGLDYMERADDMRKALTGIARDAGQTGLADAVEDVEEGMDRLKAKALHSLPVWLQESLPYLGLLTGLGLIGAGLTVKLRVPGAAKGRTLRDVGRILTAPGIAGVAAISLLTWRAAPVLRINVQEYWRKLGTPAGADTWELTRSYGPSAWDALGWFCVIGVLLAALSLAALPLRGRWEGRKLFVFGLVRRFVFWMGLLALGYFAVAMAASIVSYNGALRVVMLPWRLDPLSNVVTMSLLALGVAMARSGTIWMREEEAEAA